MTSTHRLAAVSVAFLISASACGGGSSTPTAATEPSTGSTPTTPGLAPPPLPHGVLASIVMPAGPLRLAAGFGSVWAAAHRGNVLYRVDPATNKVIARIHVGTESCGAPATGLGRVWVEGCGPGPLVVVDPKTNRVVARTHDETPLEMAVANGKIWAPDPVDPDTLHPTAHVDANASDVASGAGSMWFIDTDAGIVKRVDPATATVTRSYRAGKAGSDENFGVFANGALWVYSGGNQLWRIDPTTNTVTSHRLRGITAYAQGTFDVADGAVWVRPWSGKVYRFDLTTFSRKAYPANESSSGFVLVAFGSVWESNLEGASLWRVRE